MKRGPWVGFLYCLLGSCGQELELPVEPPEAGANAGAGPASGTTGLAGAGDELPPERLPLADTPLFGEAGAGGSAEGSSGGAADSSPEAGAAGAAHGGSGGGGGGGGRGGGGGGGNAGSAGSAGSGAGGKLPALMFTEYVEGSGSLKALEIYAISAASLEGCELETYFNGKLVAGKLALHGELAAGKTQVLCSSALATAQPALCSRSTNLTFNGDDALALTCAGTPLDVIGQLGVDPGQSWGKGATADHTLRRRCEVSSGRVDGTTPFDPALEWSSFAADTFVDLGKWVCP